MAKGHKSPRIKGGKGKKFRKNHILDGSGFGVSVDPSYREDLDEHLVDINFASGNPLSEGIPWRAYLELEIQTILKMHFEMLDFDTIWRHRDDPANENGVDLEFSRKSDARRVLVAVKKNPKKEALAQIVELANQTADERIYVYVGSATQSFRDQLNNFQSKVQFWDEKMLESNLNETGLTLDLQVANSKANGAMTSIWREIMPATAQGPRIPPPSKLSAGALEVLWGLKDRAVTTNKCAGMAQLMLESPDRFGELSHERLQNLVLFLLDYIYVYGLLSIQNTMTDLPAELRSLLRYVYQKDPSRSNWLELFQYRPGPVPGRVERMHEQFVSDRKQWSKIAEVPRSDGRTANEPGFDWTPSNGGAETFRGLGIWAHGLESTIDSMFAECVAEGRRE